MPTDIILTGETLTESERKRRALDRLRQEANPFDSTVVSVSTVKQNLESSVPEYTETQLSDLLEIIDRYRKHQQGTQSIPIVGPVGSGKTQLLNGLKSELRILSAQKNQQTCFVEVPRMDDRISEPLIFLLSLITDHLLEKEGDGAKLLKVIAGRVTGKLLSEALGLMTDAKRVELIPSQGFWTQLSSRLGSQKSVNDRLVQINRILQLCADSGSSGEAILQSCVNHGLEPKIAFEVIQKHLLTTESKNELGKIRQRLYTALSEFVLFQNIEKLEDSINEEVEVQLTMGFTHSRNMLKVWLETLYHLQIPVCIVFDQMESIFDVRSDEIAKLGTHFASTLATFVNELHNVCILIFAEEGWWTAFLSNVTEQMRMRLYQPISLKGKPALYRIQMPSQVSESVIQKIIQNGVKRVASEVLDWNLPPEFPFDAKDIKNFQKEGTTIRLVLRKLVTRYNEIVYTKPPEPPDLKAILSQIWKRTTDEAAKKYGDTLKFKASQISAFQNALHRWLSIISARKVKRADGWKNVDLITDGDKSHFGHLNLIRFVSPTSAGIGIAFWLAQAPHHVTDLSQRLSFFNSKPCPIVKLVLLRADGADAVSKGKSKTVFDEAIAHGRDVRIQQYDAKTLHQILAFETFFSQASTELDNCKDLLPNAEQVMDQFLVEISQPILNWVEGWQQPLPDKLGLFQ